MKHKQNIRIHHAYGSINMKATLSTNDQVIRAILKSQLEALHKSDETVRIIEELGVNHGSARVDIAVVNGVMHGYEIKSDQDTLQRLPEQVDTYNAVFDKVTLVVGLTHLYEAIYAIPDWWGITVVRQNRQGSLVLNCIRQPEQNRNQDAISIARLLWRTEALSILEDLNAATGVKTKARSFIYERLVQSLQPDDLQARVRQTLCFRGGWRADEPLALGGGSSQPSATAQYCQASF